MEGEACGGGGWGGRREGAKRGCLDRDRGDILE